jgi:hypothetical protein
MEVETNHCDGWPSKDNPLKMNVAVKKDMNEEIQGEMGRTIA